MSTVFEAAADIFRVDVNYPILGQTCCYVIRQNNKAAIVDCGGKRGPAEIAHTLKACGVAPENVEWVIPTHAHLDHAGAAGQLMIDYPNAVLAAHPSTVKHLIDPYKVLVGAVESLYGKSYYNEHYGRLHPVPAERTHTLADDEEILLAEARPLRALHTPGHAWHHLSIYDKTASFLVAGDAYGVSYREMDASGKSLIVPVMPPTQFHPDAMEKTIRRLGGLNAETVGVAHFGEPADSTDLTNQQLTALAAWQVQADILYAEGRDNFYKRMFDYLLDWSVQRAMATGVDVNMAHKRHKSDSHLSARGFLHLLDKQQRENA